MRLLLISLSILVLFGSCKEDTPADSGTSAPVEIPEDFVTFYNKFHTDTAYQKAHIVFPLSEKTDGSKWLEENWVYHKPFDDLGGEFSRDFENLNGLITETMTDKTGTVTIRRRFTKMSGEYHLIYYTIESKFGQ